ncbi:DUF1214 domain-containing protein [Pimelobacter simplex]|uniref:DUF1254 domain-containing protein n=1 Tax=Nocardioides simplex TaxID=2045 RepID=UPI0008E2CA5E|nr:DUF1214 domain-containing protein [Pimelobacter simplex]MCG8154514.1 DUF1214 domain-containing protein [Pimelobacter simplex]GEB12563.1 hypothetical protein NSI01_08780 [Pimelobacter simplex]SFM93253.1 Uncharacterized conserved protein [Pimelobacter simplex]
MPDLADRVAALQTWAYPLVFAQRMRLNLTQPLDPQGRRPATSAGAPAGVLGHQRALADPSLAVGVAPNVDTLYSLAWLDLDEGAYALTLPDPGDRYLSLQVGCADTSSPLVVSGRTHGRELPEVRLRRGPRSVSEDGGVLRLSTPERWVMVVGRTGVDPHDATDVAAAHALQDAITLVTPGAVGGAPRDIDRRLARLMRQDEILDPATFLVSLAAVVADLGPGQVPDEVARTIDELGPAADEPTLDAVAAGLRAGYDAVRSRVRHLGRTMHGWSVNDRGADFGDDLLLRAAVAHAQIYVNPAAEALYPVCETDADGNPLEGSAGPYLLEFPPGGLPPARAFWSLTMYHGEGLLVENPIRRYAIGDRTPGLTRDPDGALRIHLSVTEPGAGHGNWLPAPEGRFRLMLRLYWPEDAARWSPPPVVRVVAA